MWHYVNGSVIHFDDIDQSDMYLNCRFFSEVFQDGRTMPKASTPLQISFDVGTDKKQTV